MVHLDLALFSKKLAKLKKYAIPFFVVVVLFSQHLFGCQQESRPRVCFSPARRFLPSPLFSFTVFVLVWFHWLICVTRGDSAAISPRLSGAKRHGWAVLSLNVS